MRVSKRAWRMLATAVAVPGSALGALAGFAAVPAMAGAAQPQPPSPDETFFEYSASTIQFIPVYASGIFKDQGHLEGVGSGSPTGVLRHGNIYLSITGRHISPWLSQQSCNGGDTVTFLYTITGGTGRYQTATGAGTGSLEISAVVRRINGTCDGNQPIPKTLRITLDVSGSFSTAS